MEWIINIRDNHNILVNEYPLSLVHLGRANFLLAH